jgi:hypothetical protein
MNKQVSLDMWAEFQRFVDSQTNGDEDRAHLLKLVSNKKWRKDGSLPRGFDRQHGDTTELEQTIVTPDNLVDAVREIFGGEIALDPCAAPSGEPLALVNYRGPGDHTTDGLAEPWCPKTYVNPPYGKLKDWLSKVRHEALLGKASHLIVLCPVRTNRVWWQETREVADAYIELGPVKFKGYDSAFPVPLCLMVWGHHYPWVRATLEKYGVTVRFATGEEP